MRKAVRHLRKSDPTLAAIIEQVGPFRMEYAEPTFHSLAESILYQQLNGKAAVTIFRRFTGLVEFERLGELSDEDVIRHLTQVKGVGVWTAHMFLMFTLRRPDILPTGDYGIQAAIRKHYRKRKLPKPKDMERIARPWSPYRSVACWYLWRSLDIETI